MRVMRVIMVVAMIVAVTVGMAIAQAPQGGRGGGGQGGRGGGRGFARGPVLAVTSNAWPDGGEIPLKNSGARGIGMNVSPDFTFQWFNGMEPAQQPDTVQSFAVVFHDMENSTNRGTTDTLHWTVYNIPATAKGVPEGLAAGVLPDGTTNGPGIGARGGAPGSYFGPGAGPGPFHHYVFEFYALDTKLQFENLPTREQLMQAMEGHVVGKAVYFGRFRTPPQ